MFASQTSNIFIIENSSQNVSLDFHGAVGFNTTHFEQKKENDLYDTVGYDRTHFDQKKEDLNLLKFSRFQYEVEKQLIRSQQDNSRVACFTNNLMFSNIEHDFASKFFNSRGLTSIIKGEHMIVKKCESKVVKLRETQKCFEYIPVEYKNEEYFLTPTTHFLVKSGKEIDCTLTLPKYFFNGTWVVLVKGKFYKTEEPDDLNLFTEHHLTLNFETTDFSFNSIKDTNDFQNEIENEGDLHSLVMSVRGATELDERFSFTNQKTDHWFPYLTSFLDSFGLSWISNIFGIIEKAVILLVLLFFLSIIFNWIRNFIGIFYLSGFSPALLLCFSNYLSKRYIKKKEYNVLLKKSTESQNKVIRFLYSKFSSAPINEIEMVSKGNSQKCVQSLQEHENQLQELKKLLHEQHERLDQLSKQNEDKLEKSEFSTFETDIMCLITKQKIEENKSNMSASSSGYSKLQRK